MYTPEARLRRSGPAAPGRNVVAADWFTNDALQDRARPAMTAGSDGTSSRPVPARPAASATPATRRGPTRPIQRPATGVAAAPTRYTVKTPESAAEPRPNRGPARWNTT